MFMTVKRLLLTVIFLLFIVLERITMGNLMSRRFIGICCLISLLAIPTIAAGNATDDGKITSLWGLIGNPIDSFNSLDPSTRSLVQWGLGLLLVALIICVAYGVVKNAAKTSVGSSSKDAKLTTSGITDNINIGLTLLVGVIILGVAIALIMGLGK
jgi:hypothetical protein